MKISEDLDNNNLKDWQQVQSMNGKKSPNGKAVISKAQAKVTKTWTYIHWSFDDRIEWIEEHEAYFEEGIFVIELILRRTKWMVPDDQIVSRQRQQQWRSRFWKKLLLSFPMRDVTIINKLPEGELKIRDLNDTKTMEKIFAAFGKPIGEEC